MPPPVPSPSRRLVLAMLAGAAGACGRSWAGDPAVAVDGLAQRDGPMRIGTNVDGLAYWSTALPTIDAMKSAGAWIPQNDSTYDTGEQVFTDRQGWVTRLPRVGEARYTSVVVNVIHDNPAALASARYVVLYDGAGDLAPVAIDGAALLDRAPGRLLVRGCAGGSLFLRLAATDPADHLRNIRVVREDLLPLHRAGHIFDPAFTGKLANFAAIRFMDWANTNLLFGPAGAPLHTDADVAAVPLLEWTDRPLQGTRAWGDSTRGVPVEAMVDLANRTGITPWFNMPVNASDGYVEAYAGYVRDHLRGDLRIRVELSNEVWNWMFPQARYAQARAREMWGADASWMRWYGTRAAQVGRIWKNAFGERGVRGAVPGRIAMVYATQFAWKGLEAAGLDTPDRRTSDWFDEYAITGYYDGAMNNDAAVATVHGWWKDRDGGFARAIAALRARIAEVNAPLYLYHAGQARARGLRLVTYESGFGETTPVSQHGDDAYTDFLIALQRRPEMYALEQANYYAFDRAGGSLFMNFGLISKPGRWGSWSALESVTQRTSPRYRALQDWIATHRG